MTDDGYDKIREFHKQESHVNVHGLHCHCRGATANCREQGGFVCSGIDGYRLIGEDERHRKLTS